MRSYSEEIEYQEQQRRELEEHRRKMQAGGMPAGANGQAPNGVPTAAPAQPRATYT